MGHVAWPARLQVILCCSFADLKILFLSMFGKKRGNHQANVEL